MSHAGHSRAGTLWLLGDMVLVTVLTVLVKLGGASYPAVQMELIRSLVGSSTSCRSRGVSNGAATDPALGPARFSRPLQNGGANANLVALTALPLELVNAIRFMWPLVVLALATVMLNERSSPWQQIGLPSDLPTCW